MEWAFWIGVICIGLSMHLGQREQRRQAKLRDDVAATRNAVVLTRLPDFSGDVIFAGSKSQGAVAIDVSGKRFAVTRPNQKTSIYAFDQLVGVQVEQDGDTVYQTDRGSQLVGAAVGAALAGGAGLIVGGLSASSRSTRAIRRLSLKILTNDVHSPVNEIIFFAHPTGAAPEDIQMKQRAVELDEWYARFRAILHGRTSAASILS